MPSVNRVVSFERFEELRLRYRSWGRWGDADQVGALNEVTSDIVIAAAGLVQRGVVFSLGMRIDRSGPDFGSPRFAPLHFMTMDGGDVERAHRAGERGPHFTDDVITMPLQCATQWDALSHVFYDGVMYNNGDTDMVDSFGAHQNSMLETRSKMVGRGVLLDVPRMLGRDWLEPGEAIEAEDLEACCVRQGVAVAPGDFILVRTGRMAAARERGSWGDEFTGGPAAGLGVSTAEFLADRRVAAVALDTFSTEVVPSQTDAAGVRYPLHVILLQSAGIHLGEFFELDELAEDCAADSVWSFLFAAPPLPVAGAVGSAINPQAIK